MKEATNIIKKYKFDDYELKKNFDKKSELTIWLHSALNLKYRISDLDLI